MSVQLIDPAALPAPQMYRQMAVASGSRTVYLSGQVARTAAGEPVGAGDLAAQVEQAYRNVAAALAEVGATFDDVAKLTVYVVDWSPEKLADLGAGVTRAAEAIQGDPVRPTTLLGVSALGEPDLLVEVEAVAVLD
ncbi:RidA family protein [Geodermatophilus sabuli]|uniref:RidA family protein n=1 Tax=Geodermatophilus sabuli TaxID=1564158 RepID=A0A7K3W476_9ACTN|nr:RidA family protein [Geodermatophilus sabuli]NEK59592.1 RidA family protein [Geodermatophilus sabuli]